ncbi:MAG TPA: class I adenylate-forming enzyme family protein [Anaerolineales bacterium]|nr:class I adenylate-forming enzyme family protein [Anaerolineales bacterium]
MLNTHMTMYEAFFQVAEPRRKQLAMVCGDERHTYGELLDRVHRLAAGLLSLGIRKGDRVVGFLSPGAEFAGLFFALAEIGGVFVPLNPLLRSRSIGQVVQDADPVMLVTEQMIEGGSLAYPPSLRYIVRAGRNSLPSLPPPKTEEQVFRGGVKEAPALLSSIADERVIKGEVGTTPSPPSPKTEEHVFRGGVITTFSLEQLAAREAVVVNPAELVSPEDLLTLLYTSGTTGTPKGTMHSHRSLIAPVVASLRIRDLWLKRPNLKTIGQTAKALARYKSRLLRVAGKPQTFLSTVSWHGITGIEVMLQAVLMGDTIVVMPHFHPRQAMELIQKEKVTILVAIPTAYQAILSLEDFNRYDTSSLLICGTGAMPCPPDLGRKIQERFGSALHIGFGATEVAGGIAIPSIADSSELQATTVGKPLPGVQVKIVDEAGNALPMGQVGELMVRGEMIMLGYYHAPEVTSSVIDKDGWYAMGDMAKLDEQGYLHIMGRKKDLIIRSGQNIYPAEIEAYLVTHPDIQEAAVVGVPSPVSGEEVWAFVIPKPGRELSVRQVLEYCRKELEAYRIPNQVRIVEDFPRTDIGKPQKYLLKAGIIGGLEKDSQHD